jgi:mRNA-degrading endonuclease RelE of RelBE toxin-antitoxin system
MAYEIILTNPATTELKTLRAYDRRRVVDEIEKQLMHQPTVETRNRKLLAIDPDIDPDFAYEPPIWELRIDEFRVFYDVNDSEQAVTVRAVRRKRYGQTTEEIIHERDDS